MLGSLFFFLYFRPEDIRLSFLNRKADMRFTLSQCGTIERADRIVQKVGYCQSRDEQLDVLFK